MKSKMAADTSETLEVVGLDTQNVASFPPEIDIPDTPDLSVLRFDFILDEKSNRAAHP